MAKFSKYRVWGKVPEGSISILIFGDTRIFERSLHAKTSLIRPVSSTEHRLVTDIETDRHRAIASTRAGIASRGKKTVLSRRASGGGNWVLDIRRQLNFSVHCAMRE